MTEQPQPGEYPRQELLPQEVQEPRSRRRWWVVGGVLAVVLVAAATAFLLARDGDDGARAAYCDRLAEVTADGDLDAALAQADESTVEQVRSLAEDAPGAVADDWGRVVEVAEAVEAGGEPNMSDVVGILGALQAIAADAEDECGLRIDLPVL
jgi:hypothetical protein